MFRALINIEHEKFPESKAELLVGARRHPPLLPLDITQIPL